MKRLRRVAGPLLLAALAAAIVLAWVVGRVFAGSLPPLDGTVAVTGPSADVTLTRDDLGVVTVEAETRRDVAFGLGFAHAQDRLFQMDLLRRFPAGELSELLGEATHAVDNAQRTHRFRARAAGMIAALPQDHRALLDAYAAGVNAGRRSLAKPPWEYLLLQAEFEPWRPEDSLLVALGMFIRLQDHQDSREIARRQLHATAPPALAAFLDPLGSSLDAPLLGAEIPTPPLPTPDVVDLRKQPPFFAAPALERPHAGSNNWAVDAAHSKHGGAIVACDMHLTVRVPNTWYRAVLKWADRWVVGVTMPGTPVVVIGSNGRVAWGFTNAEVDVTDLIPAEGPVTEHVETVRIAGQPSVVLPVRETADGPIVGTDNKGRAEVLRWSAHRTEAVNLRLLGMEDVTTVAEALALAPTVGVPAQNLVVADDKGAIGWTLMGVLPRRVGGKWDGWITDPPRVLAPAGGLVWTANNRTNDDPRFVRGTYDHGARARQIRDALRAKPKHDEADLLAIQLDAASLFFERWRDLFVTEASKHPKRIRPEVVSAVRAWDGMATPDAVGLPVVKEFRRLVRQRVLGSLTRVADLDASVEGSLWEVVTKRPPHLVPTPHRTWDEAFGAILEEVDRRAGSPLVTHGARNAPSIRHPLSGGLGPVGRWMKLDMDDTPVPGDDVGLPRVQDSHHMASQRLVVSPGREERGLFHMPTGQSGHFLSPFYRAGHADWAQGRASPLLPGPARHTLVLKAR